MGQRADGLLRAFDGAGIDWGVMLGTGLADVPQHYVSVYRDSSLEEIMRIVREGLSVPPLETRHPDMRAEMELLDRYRPKRILDKGISRMGAIFTLPTPHLPERHTHRDRYLLEVKVDPNEAYVSDMDFISNLIPFLGMEPASLDRYRGSFTRYWESMVSLTDFKQHYRRIDGEEGSHWLRKSAAPAKLPKAFFSPEVMVMTPIIGQRHVRIVRRESPEVSGGHDDEFEEVPIERGMTWEDER